MDTSGHTALSAVGEHLLKPALKKSNSDKEFRIGAFYFGNWLTDVSQCIDPIAYRNAVSSIDAVDKIIKQLFDKWRFDAPSWMPSFMNDITAPLKALQHDLSVAEKELIADIKTALNAGSSGKLAKAFKDAFRFIGYSKFVADDDGQPVHMDPEIYLKLFDARFTQYFPHEHLDRPELTPQQFESAKANGPLNKRTKTDGEKDLYAYLRSDIRIAAGLLSYLDSGTSKTKAHQSWAGATFHKTRTKFSGRDGQLHEVDDKNYEWNYHLAMLGHALHAIEDFFAHSTFVEHASANFPKQYNIFQRYEEAEVLTRRLKEWDASVIANPDSWRKLKVDTHIVTGYFDFQDTIISLEHLLDHVLKRPNKKMGAKADNTANYHYEKILSDTLELVSDFDTVWHAPKNNPKHTGYSDDYGNVAVKMLREKGGEELKNLEGSGKLNKIVDFMIKKPLAPLPQAVKDSFSDSVKLFGAIGLGKSLYKSLLSIHQFMTTPLLWLEKFLPTAALGVLKDFGEVYLKNLVLDRLGAKRIGCHSLIAKDSGPELFSTASTECAKAVHWYIVQILTRHYRRPVVDAARCDDESKNRNAVYLIEQLDWLELCEYFLCHPFARITSQLVNKETSEPIEHITRPGDKTGMSPDSLLSLVAEYAPTFRPEPGVPVLTWQVIADANFLTRGMDDQQRAHVVNRVLKNQKDGLIVSDGINYAFVPKLRIVIPYQKTKLSVLEARDISKSWWYPVIVGPDGYKSVAAWFGATGALAENAPSHAHRPFPVTKADNDQFYEEVLAEQNALRKLYEGSELKELY